MHWNEGSTPDSENDEHFDTCSFWTQLQGVYMHVSSLNLTHISESCG
jgi:hypothetical protein